MSGQPAHYTLQLMVGVLAPRWSKVVQYADDATAIAESGRLLSSEHMTRRGRTSMLVGRGREPDIQWLGAWHLDDELIWMASE